MRHASISPVHSDSGEIIPQAELSGEPLMHVRVVRTPAQKFRDVIEGHRVLFRFLFVDGWQLFAAVATAWDNARVEKISTAEGAQESRSISFGRVFVDGYNRRYEDTKLRMRDLVRNRGHFVPNYVVPLFMVRIATVIAAAFFGLWATLFVSLLQFVVAPYSFFAAIAAWLGVLPFYVIHFAFFAVAQTATGMVYAHYPVVAEYARVPINYTFIGVWLLIDQGICLLFCFWTPIGKPVRLPATRILQSFWYGFINTKTYWLLLLLCLRGLQVDLLALIGVALLPSIFRRIANRGFRYVLPPHTLHWTFSSAMFYHYHRMVHLPGPYNEAHRHHHQLTDATPFDAHQYGSGMPEEWLKLITEIGVCAATGLMPWSFTFPMLGQSVSNKVGHTRLEGEHPVLDNFHVNHHLKHFRNFGFAGFPLDLLFGTALGDVSRMDNANSSAARCTKHTDATSYVLVMQSPSGLDVAPRDLPLAPPLD